MLVPTRFSVTDATDRALLALDEFLNEWLGPAAVWAAVGNGGDQKVRKAIQAIAADYQARDAIGYAVFSQQGDADADIGFRVEMVSALFEDRGQAVTALRYCETKKAQRGVRYFVGKLSDLT